MFATNPKYVKTGVLLLGSTTTLTTGYACYIYYNKYNNQISKKEAIDRAFYSKIKND
tara:strand:- start:349 stop:519 length:171 start_codon:yes stop_codon:yes gene_type:complete